MLQRQNFHSQINPRFIPASDLITETVVQISNFTKLKKKILKNTTYSKKTVPNHHIQND